MKFPKVVLHPFNLSKILLILFFVSSGVLTSAFGQIKSARAEMEQYNYSKAIEILHQFIQKADPKTKAEATLLMADCYRLQNDMQDARAWYLKAIRMGRTEPLTYFYYAKALRACGDYEAAKKIFLRYDSLMPEDHRGKIYASFCDSAIAWDEKPYAFEVNNARNLNSSNNEFGPVFYNDGIMFVTDRIMTPDDDKKNALLGKGYNQLVFSRPKQKEEFYGEYTMPRPVPELFSNGNDDGPASFSKDGNEIFISRTVKSPDKTKSESLEGPAIQLKIYTATKSGDKWSKLKPFFFNSPKYSVGHPALSPDGGSLFFISDVEGGYGGTDIYVSSREGSTWNPPLNLGPIVNTFGNEMFPFVADNGDLYFASDGHPGYGGLDIFVTRKVGNVWLIPQNLGKPINSSYDDFALALYKNDSVGLFSANRPGGRGEDDIYSFRVVGPLPQITSPTQPAIAAVTKVPPKSEPEPEQRNLQKEEVKPAEKIVPVPSPVTAEVKPPAEEPQQEAKPEPQAAPKEEPKPGENIIPVPSPVTAEVKPPVEKPKQEVKPEPQATPKEEPKPGENIIPVPSPVTAEVKPPVEEPKQEAKPEPQAAPKEEPKPGENIIPVPSPVTAEVKPPVEEPKQEAKPEPQAAPKEEPKPVEVIVTVPSPVTAEVKPPVEEPRQEVKPEPKAAPKEEPKPVEVIVPVPSPLTAEVKPPAEEPRQEAKPEPQAASKEEPKPVEVIVPVPSPVTAEVKPPAEEPRQEAKPEPQAAPKEEPKPVEVIVPVPSPVTAEVKPTAEEPRQEAKPEPQAAPKEETKPVENIIPVPTPVTAEVKPPAEEPRQEVKPEPQAVPKEEPKPVKNILPVPTPVTAEVKPPAEEPRQEAKPEPKAVQKEEPKPVEDIIPVPSPVTAEVKPPAEEPRQEAKPEPQATPKEETKPVENIILVPSPVTAEVKPPAEEPKKETSVEEKPSASLSAPSKGNQIVFISGCIKDLSTREPIADATVFILDEEAGRVMIHKSNPNGCFRSAIETGDRYLVKAMRTGYSSYCIPFNSDTLGIRTEISLPGDFFLDRMGAIHSFRVKNIYYDFDKFNIRPDAEPSLDKLASIMNNTPVTVEMGSHADCRGSFEYNVGLTQRRATSAMTYIVNKGVSASRITSKWYGKTQLVNDCNCAEGVHCTEAEHQMNRRTEFRINIPAPAISEQNVDLERLKEGDTVAIRYFPDDFFRNCAHQVLGGTLAELETLFGEFSSGILYTVQIGAFSFLTPHFKNLNDVMSCRGSDGILRCFVGRFTSMAEAAWYRDHLRSGEYKDAFVTMMDHKHQPGKEDPNVMASNR